MATVVDTYRTRFDVEGAQKAEREMLRAGQAVQSALKTATDPTATGRNVHQLREALDRSERSLLKFRDAMGGVPTVFRGADVAMRSTLGGVNALAGAVPGLSAVSGVLLGPVGIAAGLTAMGAAALRSVPATLDKLSGLGDTAERLGITAEAMQELQGAMVLMTEDAAKLEPALSRLQEVTGQAAMGMGEGATAFKQLGLEARNADGSVKGLSQLLPEIADRIASASSEAEKMAIAQRLFGEQGRALVRVLGEGSEGLARFATQARDAGLVLEEDLVEQARAADGQMKLMTERIDKAGDRILVGLAPPVVFITEKIADFVTWISRATSELGRFDDAIDQSAGRASVTSGGVAQMEKMIAELESRRGIGGEKYQAGLEAQIAQRREQLAFMQMQVLQNGPPISWDAAAPAVLPPPSSPAAATRAVTVRTSPVSAAAGGSASGTSAEWRRELAELNREQAEATRQAREMERAYRDTFESIDSGLELIASTGNNAFGRLAGDMQTSLRYGRDLVQTLLSINSALTQFGGGAGGFLQSAGGGLSGLLSGLDLPGWAASIGAMTGATTGNFGGAAALASGVPAALSLGLGGYADGGSFTVGGKGGRDRTVVQFLAQEGEHVRITPRGQNPGGGAGVNVTVNNYSGQPVQTRERARPNGGMDLEVIVGAVEQRLAGGLQARRGPLLDALRGGFVERAG